MPLSACQAKDFRMAMYLSVCSTHDPRYLKSSTHSSSVPSEVCSGGGSSMLIGRPLVFLAFMAKPTFLYSLSTLVSSFCACSISSERSEISSAKSRSVRTTLGCLRDFLGCMVKPSSYDDDDDEGRINFSVALSPKTTRTRNNKLKQWSHVIVSQRSETFLVKNVKNCYNTITWLAATTRRLITPIRANSSKITFLGRYPSLTPSFEGNSPPQGHKMLSW